LHQNRQVSAFLANDVPFGGIDDEQTSKTDILGALIGILQKKSNAHGHIFKTMHRIGVKFDMLMWSNAKTSRLVLHD